MNELWYAEERNFAGEGKPVTFPHDPRKANYNKHRMDKISNVHVVPQECRGMTLDELHKRFAQT